MDDDAQKTLPCPDCGETVSRLAASCPHCGRPMPRPTPPTSKDRSPAAIIFQVIQAVGLILAVGGFAAGFVLGGALGYGLLANLAVCVFLAGLAIGGVGVILAVWERRRSR